MFSAEASAAKATTMASRKALSLANRCTVASTQAGSLELAALRLTGPTLRKHWSHHPCSHQKKNKDEGSRKQTYGTLHLSIYEYMFACEREERERERKEAIWFFLSHFEGFLVALLVSLN